MGPCRSSSFRAGSYLTFRLSRHDFAIEAARVRGILPWQELTAGAEEACTQSAYLHEYAHLAGVARTQGQEFPVIDLAARLGLTRASPGRCPCIVAVEIATPEGTRLAGFVADSVSELIAVRERDYRRRKIRAGGRPRTLLDPDVSLAPEGLEQRSSHLTTLP